MTRFFSWPKSWWQPTSYFSLYFVSTVLFK